MCTWQILHSAQQQEKKVSIVKIVARTSIVYRAMHTWLAPPPSPPSHVHAYLDWFDSPSRSHVPTNSLRVLPIFLGSNEWKEFMMFAEEVKKTEKVRSFVSPITARCANAQALERSFPCVTGIDSWCD